MDPRFTPTFRVIPVAAPAAGAEIDVRSERSAGWLVRSVRASLTTSAVAGARCSVLAISDGTREYFRSAPGATQAASLTRSIYGFSGSTGAPSTGANIGIGLPSDGLWLPQGHHLLTLTENIDVADQYAEIWLSVFEFPVGEGVSMWPFVTTYLESSE